MYKNIILSSLVCFCLLVSNVGCGKKEDHGTIATEGSTTSAAEVTKPAELGANVDKKTANAVVDKLRTDFPQMKISRIENAPISGFYQVLADGDVFYISHNSELMFVGDVISLDKQGRTNLTEEVRKSSRYTLLQAIPESDMVVFTPKSKVEHMVTVFTDVDCGYCRKFHSEIQAYLDKGIKIRYLPFPRAGKNSDSYNKAATVWCAKDPQDAMNKATLTETFKADATLCAKKSVVDNSLNVVRKLGLNGTPALLLEDGTLIPGYMPADNLKAALDDHSKKKQAMSSNASPRA
jgi:thiol:disulfide interchange protein DsbC